MTFLFSRLRLLILVCCWLVVGYSLHVILREKLLASTLIFTQQSMQHENVQHIAEQIKHCKQQESTLRTLFNSTFNSLQNTKKSKNLIDCVQHLNSKVRVFAPRDTVDNGWYQEQITELTLEGSSEDIFAFLNQAAACAQLTSLSWTVLENNQNECAMIWHSYYVNGAVLGKPCSSMGDTNSIFTKPSGNSSATFFTDNSRETSTPNVRGIVVRDGQMAALLYYNSAYSIVFEGDILDDYDIVKIMQNSIVLNHHKNGKSVINL